MEGSNTISIKKMLFSKFDIILDQDLLIDSRYHIEIYGIELFEFFLIHILFNVGI